MTGDVVSTPGRHRRPSRWRRWRFNRELRRQVREALGEAEADEFLAIMRGTDRKLPDVDAREWLNLTDEQQAVMAAQIRALAAEQFEAGMEAWQMSVDAENALDVAGRPAHDATGSADPSTTGEQT